MYMQIEMGRKFSPSGGKEGGFKDRMAKGECMPMVIGINRDELFF
jgi:hypothetical protein